MTSKIGFFERTSDDFKRFERYAKSNVYHIENSEPNSRIIVWSTHVIDTLLDLVKAMEEPYYILYILHVSRSEEEPARYQSHELALSEMESFFLAFEELLKSRKFSKQLEPIYLPVPHSHLYNSEFDQQEIDILHFTTWYKSPLVPEDY